MIIRQGLSDNVKKKNFDVTDEEKNRKRNFVGFICVCEKFFVPLHAFRVCTTIALRQHCSVLN